MALRLRAEVGYAQIAPARPGRQSLDQSVNGALDSYAVRPRKSDRKNEVDRALDDAHDALGIPRRTGRFVPADSFGKKF